ncbi:MAG: hypothetical protein U0L35_00680 [Methanobrevibacter sp.]|nr:hypothetical protein [Methanobrevibacter sp.]
MKLDYFFDTNVIVGYSIPNDYWNNRAKKAFKKEGNHYWSTTVKNESIKVIFEIMDNYEKLFYKIKGEMTDDMLVKKEDFVSLVKDLKNHSISKNNRKFNLAETVWIEGGWYEDASPENISEILDDLFGDLHVDVNKNFNECMNSLILHERKENYQELLDMINSIKLPDSSKKIHKPDNYIILDSHDLGRNIRLNFITSDKQLLVFKEMLKEITEIDEMTYLGDLT